MSLLGYESVANQFNQSASITEAFAPDFKRTSNQRTDHERMKHCQLISKLRTIYIKHHAGVFEWFRSVTMKVLPSSIAISGKFI